MAKRRNRRNNNSKNYSNKEISNGKETSNGEVSTGTQDQNSSSGEGQGSGENNKVGPTNDPEWYARDPQLLLDAARIPFNEPFGSPIQFCRAAVTLPSGQSIAAGALTNLQSAQGVCSIRLKPSYGWARDRNDPINVAANMLYTHVRYNNSGRKNYDPADLFLYVSAMAEIYSAIVWMQRLYAYAFMYSNRNYYIADDLIRANGVIPSDLKANLANFRYWLNAYINKVAAWAVPSSIYYFKRRAFVFNNYYIENSYGNLKDQLYQFVPDGFMRFNLDSDGAGELEYMQLPGTAAAPTTISNIMAYMDNLLTYVTGDEDFGIMSGDIIRAFNSDILVLGSQSDEAVLLPIYDPVVLSQFKNADIVPVLTNAGGTTIGTKSYTFGNLMQNTDGNLIYNDATPSSVANFLSIDLDKILSVENPDPGVGDVIEATRLMTSVAHGNLLYTGSEVAVECVLTSRRGTASGWGSNLTILNSTWIGIGTTDAQSIWSGKLDWNVAMVQQFKYAPTLKAFIEATSGTQIDMFALLSNVDNYTLVQPDQVERLHQCALLSLFYVPGIAKLAS